MLGRFGNEGGRPGRVVAPPPGRLPGRVGRFPGKGVGRDGRGFGDGLKPPPGS